MHLESLLLILVLFAADPQHDAPEPLPAAEAASSMVVPDGFKVTLFAGEPDIKQPISFCIDDRGRLWVAEAYNYPNREQPPRDRIIVLEDNDGDGRADERTVFLDKLSYVTGIEVGFGGVWVMSPPEMLFIPDKDGDVVPDGPPKVLLDGFGNKPSAHNIANGFTWGPDGWLYAGHGRTSPSDIGPPGTPKAERIHCDGGVFRYHPVRHVFENFADGTTNPWGVDFDDYGQAFVSNCVNPHLFHIMQGAHYEPWRNRKSSQFAYARIPTIADHLHFLGKKPTDKLGTKEELDAGGGHAHCGTMIYLGDNWPDRYRNTVFMCNIHGRRINNDILKRDGSGYTASHGADFMLSRDPWFMGVTLQYGPDGAVYVSDWSDTGECHSYKNTRRETGRIYKITYGKANRVDSDISKLSNEQLVELQLHKNDWQVRHARRVLQERTAAKQEMKAVHDELKNLFRDNPDVTRKLRALWALHVTDGTDKQFLSKKLSHKNQYVRAWAIRLLCEQGEPSSTVLSQFAVMAHSDTSQFVRRHLASALQRLPFQKRWEIAEGLVTHAGDANDANLPLMIWYGIEPLVPNDTTRALKLLGKTKIPLIRQFIARRAAASSGP